MQIPSLKFASNLFRLIDEFIWSKHCIKNGSFPLSNFSEEKICRKLRIWPHLLEKSLTKNFIFCAVKFHGIVALLQELLQYELDKFAYN